MEHPDRDLTGVLRRVVAILLDGVAQNAFSYNSPDVATFRSAIEGFRARFGVVHDEDSALMLSGQTIQCIEQYQAGIERFVCGQDKQMRTALALLTDSLLKVSCGSEESVGRLRGIRNELETVSGMNDLAAANGRLRVCLGAICEEMDRQSRRNLEIQHDLDRAAKLEPGSGDIDTATGLPGVTSAARAIQSTINAGHPGHVFAFGVERMEAINLRFGFKVGDQILLLFAQNVAQRLHQDDTLFRWRGPCFVAVSARQAQSSMLASDMAKIVGTRLEHTITLGDREIVVPVVGSWTMLSVSAKSSVDEVARRLDEFSVHRSHVRIEGAA